MKKYIFIKNNEIIVEDALSTVTDEMFNLSGGVNFVKNIIKGVYNITETSINDVYNGMIILKELSTSFDSEEVNKAISNGRQKRSELDSKWLNIKGELGIDKPLDDFFNVALPGAGTAIEWIEQSLNPGFFKERDTFKKLNPFSKLSKWASNRSKGSNSLQEYSSWFENLSQQDQQKITTWAKDNPDDAAKLFNEILNGRSRSMIRNLTKNVLTENKFFIIKQGKLLKEEVDPFEDTKDNVHYQLLKEYTYKSLLADEIEELRKEKEDYDNDLKKLVEEFKKLLEKDEIKEKLENMDEEEIKKILSQKNIDTNK